MSKRLTNKEIKTIASRTAQEIKTAVEKKAMSETDTRTAMNDAQAIQKKIKQAEKKTSDLRKEKEDLVRAFNDANDKLKMEWSWNSDHKPCIELNLESPTHRYNYGLADRLEDDLIIEMVKHDHDLEAVLKTIKDKYLK